VDNPIELVRRWWWVLPAGVLLAYLLLVEEQAFVGGIITGAAYGLLALGLVLIYKSSGIFNFAQGEFGTVAGFTLYLLHVSGLPYLFAALGALVAAVVFGLVVERLIIRPLFDAPRVTLLVATAGVSLLAIGVEIWFGEARLRPVSPALPLNEGIRVLGTTVSYQRLLLIAVLAALAAVLAYFFNRTDLGLAILGASQEPTATELVGISVRRLSSFTWALAALLGGLAGVLAIPTGQGIGPGTMTSGFLIPAFTAAVLGGMASLPGAFLGGAIVGVAQSVAVSADFFDFIPGQAGTVIAFVLLVGVLAVKPNGLLGTT
jgi:branched-chain amino acid transport system permease protein